MKKNSKIIALVLSLVLIFAAIGGTLAYLTDKESAKNVFTVGSVDIELTETTTIKSLGSDTARELQADANGTVTFDGVMPGDVITKAPVITNTGKNDAYVRVVVEVENNKEHAGFNKGIVQVMDKAIDQVFEDKIGKDTPAYEEFYDNIFNGWGLSYLKSNDTGKYIRFAMDQRTDVDNRVLAIDSIRTVGDNDSWQFNAMNAFKSDDENENLRLNYGGIGYFYNQESYYSKLISKDASKLIYVFYIELKGTDNMTDGQKDSFKLFDGLNVPVDFDAQSLTFFDGLEISIHADAIQKQGFEDNWKGAIKALEAQHSIEWVND